MAKTPPSGNDRSRLILYVAAASGIVALVVVVLLLVVGGGSAGGSSEEKVASAMRKAGCTFETVPVKMKTSNHSDVPTLTTSTKGLWGTFPPAGGPHYGRWAVWGFYTEPVNPRMVVHNEEHGGMVLWWGPDTPAAVVERLNAFYSDDPVSIVGTPISGLGSKVAVTAWTGDPKRYFRSGYYGFGHIAVCPTFDDETEQAFTAFKEAFRGRSPEGVPLQQNQPGTS
ncbi:MAG TPA: DUF3105 domain-containing protein [Planctomycetaceae bacterium]